MKTNSSRHVTSEYYFVLRDEELRIYGIGLDIHMYSGQTTYNEKIVPIHTPMM